ncbi:MAG: hypothetical protein ACI4C1_04435 [Lachnospiraceae bacterium]
MINFEEELAKFKPSKEIDKAMQDAKQEKSLSMSDILAEVMKLAEKNTVKK